MVLKSTVAAAALLLSVLAIPASAQEQEGLVNVNISGNTVQVPVAVAAQLCDTDVNVLAKQKEKGDVACSITQQQAAERGFTGPEQGQAQQEGLVNVNIADNTVQVPVSVAAQLCDTDVNILAQQKEKGGVACTITQEQAAQRGFNQQGQGEGQNTQEQGLGADQNQTDQNQGQNQGQTQQ
jgi:hypothetical protein